MNPDEMQRSMEAMYSPSGMGGDQMEAGMSRAPPSTGRQRGPFVDQINDDVAILLMPDGSPQEVPVSQLPPGTREGQYLGEDQDAFDEEGEMRARLAAGDKGGDLRL